MEKNVKREQSVVAPAWSILPPAAWWRLFWLPFGCRRENKVSLFLSSCSDFLCDLHPYVRGYGFQYVHKVTVLSLYLFFIYLFFYHSLWAFFSNSHLMYLHSVTDLQCNTFFCDWEILPVLDWLSISYKCILMSIDNSLTVTAYAKPYITYSCPFTLTSFSCQYMPTLCKPANGCVSEVAPVVFLLILIPTGCHHSKDRCHRMNQDITT